MPDDVEFRSDLYQGTAEFYDRFRPGYPRSMLDDMVRRAAVSGRGRLLDLACGTGQVAFGLADAFSEVWAVDQEPDMIRLVRGKALPAGAGHVRAMVSAAEDLAAPLRAFELVTVGNAFHRLRREAVAAGAFGWLRPGGCLALVWADSPWTGDQDWQKAL
ncbi:MAG: class I SAM-dependent methyltransferase, partial [Pseudonocardiales bacterium]